MTSMPDDNPKYMIIKFDYSHQYIFPLKEGLTFLEKLAHSKKFDGEVQDNSNSYDISFISEHVYKKQLVENLLTDTKD